MLQSVSECPFHHEAGISLFYFVSFFSPPSTFFIEGVAWNAQKPRGRHLSRPRLPFWGPLAAIFDFAGDAALQAVQRCRQLASGPGAARLLFIYILYYQILSIRCLDFILTMT